MEAPDAIRTTAVVLAGGTGTRVGGTVPKQLLTVAGKPVVEHSVAAFDAAPDIDEVLVVMAAGFVPAMRRIVAGGRYRKVREVIEGGASRPESTYRALRALEEPRERRVVDHHPAARRVLIHDAARPFLDRRTIAACVAALRSHEAVAVAAPSSDTVFVVERSTDRDGAADGDVVSAIPPRERLRRAQTPQGFRLPVIRAAYDRAMADPLFAGGAGPAAVATDDCGVLLRYAPGVAIYVIAGSEYNMKITHAVDVALAEALATRLAGTADVVHPGADRCGRTPR